MSVLSNVWFRKLQKYVAHDIGIDLGTANTLVFVRGYGIVINEPSVVAINIKTKQVIAIGADAKKMVGRTPKGIKTVRPLVDGVVSDFEITEKMLQYFIDKVHKKYLVLFPKPKVVIGLPSGVTEVEKRAVEQAAASAGARKTYVIEEPMAAAIGCRLPVYSETGSMIVDIGGGTTEVAVISLGGIVVSRSLRIAGDELTEAVQIFLREDYNLQIGEATAEEVKRTLGTVAASKGKPKKMQVRGRNIVTGLPQEITLKSDALRVPLRKAIQPLLEAITLTLEEAPPELSGDINKQGIVLAGGGALLTGLAGLVEQETKVVTRSAENALTAVALGCGMMLKDVKSLAEVQISGSDFE